MKNLKLLSIILTCLFFNSPSFSMQDYSCKAGADKIRALGEKGEDYNYKDLLKYTDSCLDLASDESRSDEDRSKSYLTYAALMGKVASKISVIKFTKKLESGKKAYQALKSAVGLDEFSEAGAIGVAKTIIGFRDGKAPMFVLKKVGLEDMKGEADSAIEYMDNLRDNSQYFSELDQGIQTMILELREELTEI